ncbi:MAG: phosphoglycerate mutase (2,3-diphosphoglycerate-independent) [Deltaproteobacteria bacterium HGW-Deltaproteobacteria-6]|nr:MAG: phosphoglycerate mutase (2,3-diphosphoglycerate-independent) [Deltaproteobacteria bacterium HGW-Deltaproteobacteria-6]
MHSENKFPMSLAVRNAYTRGEEDETLLPLVLVNRQNDPLGRIHSGDSVIFYNIRGEREIELTRSFTEKTFREFPVDQNLPVNFATMIEYQKGLNVAVAFPPQGVLSDTLSDVIAEHGLTQTKITEAEKAVHVSFFFNGKKSDPLPGEERIVIPTRKDVKLFDEAPEMSIEEITRAAVGKIKDPRCNFTVVNFPNVDVVGHIENESAVLRAIQAVDRHAGLLIDEARKQNVAVIVTADHGTVEKWLYPDGGVDTGHTDSPVPFILLHPDKTLTLKPEGELTDIAPTILDILGLPTPASMTGASLLRQDKKSFVPVPRLLLIILDGWGFCENTKGNLIACAATPVMDALRKNHTSALLAASGVAVGLPPKTVGNSEAGHLHMGAGRRIYSDRLNIDQSIACGDFHQNQAFMNVMNLAKKNGTALHLMGIVSFFSSHGSIEHLFALMEMARKQGVPRLYIHGMLGRRGEQAQSGANYIHQVEEKCLSLELGQVVSVIGRYWSMDREDNWDRIEKTYRMLVYGEGNKISIE